jgi:N utilization substance protein A
MGKVIDIIDAIAHEKGLKFEDVQEAVKNALARTAKRVYGQNYNYKVEIDEDTKELNLFQQVVVVEDSDERTVEDSENFIPLEEAKSIDPEIEVNDELTYSLSLDNLGRTASATLANELEYHIQRVIEQKLFNKYKDKVGQIVNGTVIRVDSVENTFVEVGEFICILPMRYRIKGEKFQVNDSVKAVVRKAYFDEKKSMVVELSRTSPKFLEELLKKEVPEIKDEKIVVHKVARIPGERAKIALFSVDSSIDPIGATVGTGGVRVNSVSGELKDENIDCIEYSDVPEIFLSRAMSPAIIKGVKKGDEEDKMIILISSDQKAKAIGRSGINIRLASMLTGYNIELEEIASEQISSGEQKQTVSDTEDKGIDALKSLFKE